MVAGYENDIEVETHLAVLSLVAKTLSESVMITEADDWTTNPKIIYVNEAFTRLTGYESQEVVGQTPKLLQGKKTEKKVLQQLKRQLGTSNTWKGRTYNYTKSGQPFLMEWEIVPIHDTAGRLRFHLTVQRRVDGGNGAGLGRAQTLRRSSGAVS